MQLVQWTRHEPLSLDALKDVIKQAVQVLHSIAAREEDHQLCQPARLAKLAQKCCQDNQPLLAGNLQ